MPKLLCEMKCQDVEVLDEITPDGRKSLFITGPFLVAGQKNRNGRIYDPSVMQREVDRYRRECIEPGCAWGELSHPTAPTLNLDRVSRRVVSLERDGNVWHGRALVCNTPMGNIVRGLLESGGTIGVSSRGLGSLRENGDGTKLVGDDFRLCVAADIVADPSAPGAWVSAINEASEWTLDRRTGEWVRSDAHSLSESAYVDGIHAACVLSEYRSYTQALASRFHSTPQRVVELFEVARRATRDRPSAATLLKLEQLLSEDVKRRAH
jgi:Prohead core protein serine protease